VKRCLNRKQFQSSGLTLIEVLIALAIISIAMTAVIKAVSQNIRTTAYLEEKTIAMWVAQEHLNEARIGILKLPDAPDEWVQTIDYLGQKWTVHGSQERSSNARIQKLKFSVFQGEAESNPIVTLEGYADRDDAHV